MASGSEDLGQGLRNEDALALQADQLAGAGLCRPEPVCAAAAAGTRLAAAGTACRWNWRRSWPRSRDCARRPISWWWRVGGWLAPVSATLDQLDLVRALQLPVLLVVGMRLGCVSHARLTAQSLQASGVDRLGWIGNHIDPAMQRQDENIATLRQRTDAVLGTAAASAGGGWVKR